MATMTATLRYERPSSVAGDTVHLSAAQDTAYFAGRLTRPRTAARCLLAVSSVARARYYEPPGMIAARVQAADPVVTCAEDVLRFESFSLCGGVHARLDIEAGGFATEQVRFGTTNVDVNPPMRAALAAVDDTAHLDLEVGDEGVTVRTEAGEAVERRVKLPERWLRGFAEVQVAAAAMVLRHELDRAATVRFVRTLSRGASRGTPMWAVPAGRGLRLSRTPQADAVCLAGPERLAEARDLVPLVLGLRVYGPIPATRAGSGEVSNMRVAEPSAWSFEIPDGRLTLSLSPEVERGFSGEGAILEALAFSEPMLVDEVAGRLRDRADIDEQALVASTGRGRLEVRAALGELAAYGRLGYDLERGAYFHRDFPVGRELLEAQHPRLSDARGLVETDAITLTSRGAQVRTDGAVHTVGIGDGVVTCTCPWFAKHRGERGPCKHVLASQLARARAREQTR